MAGSLHQMARDARWSSSQQNGRRLVLSNHPDLRGFGGTSRPARHRLGQRLAKKPFGLHPLLILQIQSLLLVAESCDEHRVILVLLHEGGVLFDQHGQQEPLFFISPRLLFLQASPCFGCFVEMVPESFPGGVSFQRLAVIREHTEVFETPPTSITPRSSDREEFVAPLLTPGTFPISAGAVVRLHEVERHPVRHTFAVSEGDDGGLGACTACCSSFLCSELPT